MGVIRGKVWTPDWYPLEHHVGEPFWRKCSCGLWLDTRTNKHVEVETYSLKEVMQMIENDCPKKAAP